MNFFLLDNNNIYISKNSNLNLSMKLLKKEKMAFIIT